MTTNPMRNIYVEKITLNIGAGKDQKILEKGIHLIKHMTGIDPLKTITQKRIPGWGLRPGLPIGCKLTLRNTKATELLTRFLQAKEKKLKATQFDNQGNLSFGIHEYIDVPGVEYEPKIGVIGFEVSVTLSRPGYRVKRRTIKKSRIGKHHQITKQDAITYMQNTFGIEVQ